MESTSQVPTFPTPSDTIVPIKIEILKHDGVTVEVVVVAILSLVFISCFLLAYYSLLKWVAKVMKFKLAVAFE